MLRVWIDVTNSPHVDFFRPLVELLRSPGNEVTISARATSPGRFELLDDAGLEHTVVGPPHGGASRILEDPPRWAAAFARSAGFAAEQQFDIALYARVARAALAARSWGIRSTYAFNYESRSSSTGSAAERRTVSSFPRRSPRIDSTHFPRGRGRSAGIPASRRSTTSTASSRTSGCWRRSRSTERASWRSMRTPPEVSLYHLHGGPRSSATSSRTWAGIPASTRSCFRERRPSGRAPGTQAGLARRAPARGRRAEPRRARRRRRVCRRHHEPRGGRARNTRSTRCSPAGWAPSMRG